MKLLVISDLHIGSHARSVDLCPHPLEAEDLIGRDKNFLKEFLAFVAQAPDISTKIDAILVTGDISNRAHINEFSMAGEVLESIANALEIKKYQIFFVPGNHDVHWPVMNLQPVEYWKRHRYAPLIDGSNFFKERLAEAELGSMHQEPYYSIWHDEKYCIVGINTASQDSPTEATHHGLVPQSAIDGIGKDLRTIDGLSKKTRICLMHHHPIIYSDVVTDYPDFSVATNSEGLLELLAQNDFDLIVHGHKHNPRINYRVVNNSHPCLIVGAGSFSSLLDPVNFNGIPNLFHIIDIKGRDEKSHGIHGEVVSWAYEGSGKWGDRINNSKIPHVEVFGASTTKHEIKSSIKEILSSMMGATSVVRWSQISEKNPVLDRVNIGLVLEALKDITEEIGYELVAQSNLEKSKWLILKGSN